MESLWMLQRINKNENLISLDWNKAMFPIGRAKDSYISCNSLFVSRHHCEIRRKSNNALFICDLGSSNGTYVNETKIEAHTDIEIHKGDILSIGSPADSNKVTEKNIEIFAYKVLQMEIIHQENLSRLQNSSSIASEQKCAVKIEPQDTGDDFQPVSVHTEEIRRSDYPTTSGLNEGCCKTEDDHTDFEMCLNSRLTEIFSGGSERKSTNSHPANKSKTSDAEVFNVTVKSENLTHNFSDLVPIKTEMGNENVLSEQNGVNHFTNSNDVIILSDEENDDKEKFTVGDDVIVIDSEDEFPNSQIFSESVEDKDNDIEIVEFNVKEEDISDALASDSDNDNENEWWKKLSQSFCENEVKYNAVCEHTNVIINKTEQPLIIESENGDKGVLRQLLAENESSSNEGHSTIDKFTKKELKRPNENVDHTDEPVCKVRVTENIESNGLTVVKIPNKIIIDHVSSKQIEPPKIKTNESSSHKGHDYTVKKCLVLIDPLPQKPKRDSHAKKSSLKSKLMKNHHKKATKIGEFTASTSVKPKLVKSSENRKEKEVIKDMRKEKLKNIAEQSKLKSMSNEDKNKTKGSLRVKVTSKSRGELLAMEIYPKRPQKQNVIPNSSVKSTGQKSILKRKSSSDTSQENLKSVSFKDKSELAIVHTYLVPEGSTLKRICFKKDAPPPVKSPVNQVVGMNAITESLYSALGVICSWNPLWVQEQKQSRKLPPLYDMKTYPMVNHFKSFEDYCQIVKPLMYIELWHRICRSCEAMKVDSRKDALVGVVTSAIPWRGNLSLLTCLFRPGNSSSRLTYPAVGDLIYVEVQIVPTEDKNSHSSSGIKNRIFVTSFAYVLGIKPIYSSDTTATSSGIALSKSRLKMEVCIKRRDSYRINSDMKVQVITYLRSELRLYQSLAVLPCTKVCDIIVKGQVDDFPIDGTESLEGQDELNETQKRAVLHGAAVCNADKPGICLIQGPPGTGKSRVIVSMVQQILNSRQNHGIHPKILLCAPSNAAVDELVVRLLAVRQALPREKRFKMVRVGRLQSMRPLVQNISIETFTKRELKNAAANMHGSLESIELELRCCEAEHKSRKLAIESAKKRKQSTIVLERKLKDLEQKIQLLQQGKLQVHINPKEQAERERKTRKIVLEGADIIASTVNSCYSNLMEEVFGFGYDGSLPRIRLTCCIMDEATQCTEPEGLIPTLLGIEKYVLIGDPEQLPATVMSMEAKRLGYGQSLFSRLRNAFCENDKNSSKVHFLNVQYRMHPSILIWPNKHFYSGRISTHTDLHSSRQSVLVPYTLLSLNFHQNSDVNLSNTSEAQFVAQLAMRIVEKMAYRRFKVAIITPYARQKAEVSRILNESLTSYNSVISVNTVDGFQGQECDVVIVSCSRTKGVGFLMNSERINVALTRARYSLIICGNFQSLQSDSLWRDMIRDAKQRGIFRKVHSTTVPTDEAILEFVLKKS